MVTGTETDGSAAIPRSAWSLQRAMHRLWSDHVIWTRDYVTAALAGAPDAQAAANRLLKNQEDIGNAIVPLYGEEAGAKLTDLLKQHILIAVDLVDAAIKGDQGRFEAEDKKWDRNAEEIAEFLSGANPNWPRHDVQDLIAQHLALTKTEVVARLEKDWEKDISAFDDIMTEILTLADALSEGIIKQFPEKFGSAKQPAVDEVIDAYLAAVNERDSAPRRKLLEAAVTDDFVFTGVMQQSEGREAFDRLIGEVLAERPEGETESTVRTTDLENHHGWVRFGWAIRDARGTTVTTPEGEEIAGWYVGHLAQDGRLDRLVGFSGLPAAA